MTEPNKTTAFQLLRSLAQQGHTQMDAPLQGDKSEQSRSVGFRLAGIEFLAPMLEVDEVLYIPNCTRFPGVKPWVTGVANVRGRLLSVIDLGLFFGGKSSLSSKRSRVLTTKFHDLYAGVVVDEVLGIQSLSAEAHTAGTAVPEQFRPYVTGGVEQDGRSWTIFSLSKLARAPEFLQVAV